MTYTVKAQFLPTGTVDTIGETDTWEQAENMIAEAALNPHSWEAWFEDDDGERIEVPQ